MSYWQAEDFFGLQVKPIAPDRFPSDRADYGGVWHVTLGMLWQLTTPEQQRDLRRLQAKFMAPKRMRLRFNMLNDRGHAPLAANDPLRQDPLIQRLNVTSRNLHLTT